MPKKKEKGDSEKADYDSIYNAIQNLRESPELAETGGIRIIEFGRYITLEGINFPTREIEREFKKMVPYREGASIETIAIRYLAELKRTLYSSGFPRTRDSEEERDAC